MKNFLSLILALIMAFSSNIYTFATADAASQGVTVPEKPKAIKSIITDEVGKDYITLSFSKVKSATAYEVWIYSEKSNGFYLYDTTVENTCTVKGLKKDCVYSFRIRPVNKTENGTSYGDFIYHCEFTDTEGLPQTNSQAAAYYNRKVNSAKEKEDFTLTVKKTVETEAYSTTKYSLLRTVKNMMNLFEGTLKKTYRFKKGADGTSTPVKVIEPINQASSLKGEYIKSFEFTEKEDRINLKIKLRPESTSFTAKKTNTPVYHSSVMKKVNISRLKTAPLEIKKGYCFFDGAEISATVKNGNLIRLRLKNDVSVFADLKVSTLDFGTETGYITDTIYNFKYKGEAKQ